MSTTTDLAAAVRALADITRPVAYTIADAARATSVSVDVIRRAIHAGDLVTTSPRVDGRPIAKTLIPADELTRWALDRTPRSPR